MNSKILARFAVIVALIFVAYTIDSLVTKFSPIRGAVATIIVIMTIVQLFDFKTAVFTTTIFGLISLAYSYLIPNPTAIYFNNPLVSVFPRAMIGIISYSVFKGLNGAFKDKNNLFVKNYLARAIGGASGVLTNTVLVVTMMQLFKDQGDVFGTLVQTMIGIFFIIEFFCGLVVAPIISKIVKERLERTANA
jgi:uncharacterized membrane protein